MTTDASPREAELAAYHANANRVSDDVRTFLANVSDDAFNWRPDDKRWTMAQCLGHLIETWKQYEPVLEKAIAEGKEKNLTGSGPFSHRGFLANFIIKGVDPNNQRKLKAPKKFVASVAPRPVAEIKDQFLVTQEALCRAMASADGLHLARVKFGSPLTPIIRMTLGQAFKLLTLHAERHVNQMKRLGDHPDFPGKA